MPPSCTLLLIDDDALIHHLLRHMTQARPIHWLWARTLAEAHQLLAQNQVQGLILDMGLPDGTGAEFLQQATQLPPTLLLTGAPQEQITLPCHPSLRGVLNKQNLSGDLFLETLDQLLDTARSISLTPRLASPCHHC